VLHPYGNNPNPFGGDGTYIVYWLAVDAKVEIKVYTVAGEIVRTLDPVDKPAGNNEEFWDGKNSAGAKVASGVFIYHVQATDQRGETAFYFDKCAVLR
jgi:flagellar hook assembly protein FlgD